jgi:hypothetical protein
LWPLIIKKNTAEEYEKGDVVRIALAATDSRVRKDMKTGRVRNIKWHPVKWSPDLYRIVSVMRAQTVDNERFTKWRYTVKPVAEDGKKYGLKQFFANELQLVSYAGEDIPDGAEQPRKLLKKLNRLKPTEDEPRQPRTPREIETIPTPPPSPPRERPQRERRQPERYGWDENDYAPPPKPRQPRRKAKTPTPQPVALRRSGRERKAPNRMNIAHF